MDFYQKELKKKFGKIYGLIEPLLAPLLSRLIVIQGFLHSKDSSKFTLQIDQDSIEKNEVFVKVNKIKNKKTIIKIKQIISYITQKSPLLKFIGLRLMMKVS